MHLHHEYVDELAGLRFVVSPSVGADNWSNAAPVASQKYTAAVQATTVDWAGRTKAAQGAMQANWTASVTSGRWSNGIDRIGNGGWKGATVAKAPNYQNGYTAGKDKYLAAAQKLYPYIAAGVQQLATMPKGTVADAKARVNFWIDYMVAGKGSF